MANQEEINKEFTQWNVRNVPVQLDKEVKIHLATNNIKLYEFVLEAIKDKLKSEK